jgi:hypothetical protein
LCNCFAIKNLTDSWKTKVKRTSTSCQRRLYGFQWNRTCSLNHSICKWILCSIIFKKYLATTSSYYGKRGRNQRIKSFFRIYSPPQSPRVVQNFLKRFLLQIALPERALHLLWLMLIRQSLNAHLSLSTVNDNNF